jgi:hypothetical protein
MFLEEYSLRRLISMEDFVAVLDKHRRSLNIVENVVLRLGSMRAMNIESTLLRELDGVVLENTSRAIMQ